MAKKFKVSTLIPASPAAIYNAWLDSKRHAAMTGGGKAKASAKVGAPYTAFDGYAMGVNVELVPGKRIVQSWRTTDFASGDPDSEVIVSLEAAPGGTRLTLAHNGIPPGQEDYKSGWQEFYFAPMKAFFGAQDPSEKKAAKRKPTPAKKTAGKKAAAKKKG